MPDLTLDSPPTAFNADDTSSQNEQDNTHETALASEEGVLKVESFPSSVPSTPQKVTRKVSAEIDEIIMAYTTAYEYTFNPKSFKGCMDRAIADLINTDKNDHYTRYNLANIKHLFPNDASSLMARFVVIPSESVPAKMQILFSRINPLEPGSGGMHHAYLACGSEIECSCLSAGDIEFIKINDSWIIKSISNQTGHFLCDVGALLLPLQLLLEHNLWGGKVILRQVKNLNTALDGPEAFTLKSTEFDVAALREKCLSVPVSLLLSTTQATQNVPHKSNMTSVPNAQKLDSLAGILGSPSVKRTARAHVHNDTRYQNSTAHFFTREMPPSIQLPVPLSSRPNNRNHLFSGISYPSTIGNGTLERERDRNYARKEDVINEQDFNEQQDLAFK